jgi:hypothetical protein
MVTPDSGEGRYMGRSWASRSEADPGSATAAQLSLMRDLVGGKIAGPDFARAWLSAGLRQGSDMTVAGV